MYFHLVPRLRQAMLSLESKDFAMSSSFIHAPDFKFVCFEALFDLIQFGVHSLLVSQQVGPKCVVCSFVAQIADAYLLASRRDVSSRWSANKSIFLLFCLLYTSK